MYPRLKPVFFAVVSAFSLEATADQIALADTVIVTATRQPQRVNEAIAEVTIIDRSSIEQAGPAATIGELLSRQAGIELSRAGGQGSDESVSIRGTNSGHALILVDGIRIGSATTGNTALQLIPLSQIERIEIVRGPASALYGSDAIGGVIQIFTKADSDSPRLSIQAGAGTKSTYETSIAHANQIGNFAYSIKAGATGTGGINANESKSHPAYNDDRDGYRNNNVNLSASYKLGEQYEIGGGYFNSKNVSRYDAYQWNPSPPPWGSNVNANLDYQMDHRITGANIYGKANLSSNVLSTLRIARGTDRSESPESVIGDPISLFKTTQNQYTWQNDLKLPVGSALIALERLEQEVESTKSYSMMSRSINSLVTGWNAQIGSHAYQINLRSDDNSQFGQHETWLLGYGYRLNPSWRLATSYGTAFKAPTMNDLYFPFTPSVGVGNPNLKPEESKNGEVSLRFAQGVSHARLTYFQNTITNLITWTTNPSTYESTPDNVGQAKIKGIEVASGTTLGNWQLNANLTYQDPRDEDTGEQLRRRAKIHGLLSAIYQVGPFKGGVEFKAVGKRYDDPHWQTGINQVEMAGYALTNLFASYTLAKNWQAFARIDNVFDRNYQVARSVNVLYGTPGISAFAGLRYTLQ
jgi:vitamin B12 transporter